MGSRLVNGLLFGIDRNHFPEVAYFRRDFADDSLGALMNALALEYSGVIVSSAMLEDLGMQIGDTIALRGLVPNSNASFAFRIVGAMELFPTAYPQEGEFFVANLNYIFSLLGHEAPYRVWLATEDAIDPELLAGSLDDLGYRVLAMEDARSELAEAQAEPARRRSLWLLVGRVYRRSRTQHVGARNLFGALFSPAVHPTGNPAGHGALNLAAHLVARQRTGDGYHGPASPWEATWDS